VKAISQAFIPFWAYSSRIFSAVLTDPSPAGPNFI